MRILKKAGWLLVAMLPPLLFFIIQMATMYGSIGVFTLQARILGVEKDAPIDSALEACVEDPFLIVLAYYLLGLLVFGLWYYFAYGRKRRPESAQAITGKTVILVALSGLLLQVLVDVILLFADVLFPAPVQEYTELIAQPEETPSIWLSFIIASFLSPILEELLYRGLVFRLAEEVSKKFWVVNCIQALAFGVLHLNLVQGIYAFFFGLILGYLYGRYRHLWLCMLLHSSFNFASYYVESLFKIFPAPFRPAAYLIFSAISLVLLGIFYIVSREDFWIEETIE